MYANKKKTTKNCGATAQKKFQVGELSSKAREQTEMLSIYSSAGSKVVRVETGICTCSTSSALRTF